MSIYRIKPCARRLGKRSRAFAVYSPRYYCLAISEHRAVLLGLHGFTVTKHANQTIQQVE